MTDYSCSRLNTFDSCPYQYYLRYIAGEEPEYEHSEETFLGIMVHAALEKLYRDRMEGKEDSFTEISRFYRDNIRENLGKVRIKETSRLGLEKLLDNGEDMLAKYYSQVFRNDDRETVETEGSHIMDLPDGNGYYIRMDRLCRKDGTYYVCDYKTGSSPSSKYEADHDDQLAMYSIWVKRNFPEAKEVQLVWYMLKKDGDDLVLTSRRNATQLEKLEKETVLRIRDVESCEDFPMVRSRLCHWCMYEKHCQGCE